MKLFDFIEKSTSPYHAVATVKEQLRSFGYEEIFEGEKWELTEGKSYMVSRNGSALIAFQIPEKWECGYKIVAAHTDSPSFKIKEKPEKMTGECVTLNVEKYGGMILSTWLDRPLSMAGRVVVKSDRGLKEVLYDAGKDILTIPNLAIHMNREINKGFEYKVSTDLCPIFAGGKSVTEYVAKDLRVTADEIAGMDLFLYNRMKPVGLGEEGADMALIQAPRLDDLQCVFAGMKALENAKANSQISMLALFDNEEVGSGTRQGAGADFLEEVFERISDAFSRSREEARIDIHNSFLVSADNAHALHPNHPEKADAGNRPVMNGGVVIKHHASGNYITDGVSAAVFKEICQKAEVPVQEFFKHSDIPGGSTLGHILAERISMRGVDIGLAELAMHSSYETAGAKDTDYLVKALSCFYSGNYKRTEESDGVYYGV